MKAQKILVAAVTEITTRTSTNWSELSQPDAVRAVPAARC